MSGNAPVYDENFQQEVKKARRLFFVLLPFTLLAIAVIWAAGSGVFSGKGITETAGHAASSVADFFGGTE